MKKKCLIFWWICLAWTLYHAAFLHLNEVLKVADSFAYLQMASFLQSFLQEGLWNGWFGFVYSLPIAFINFFIWNDFLSAKIVNLILVNISAFLLWKISLKVLSEKFSYLCIILFFLSPSLLHFNIHILSENIYIPLFLALFLTTWNFVENIKSHNNFSIYKYVISIACLLWLMYLTRAEAFIYILSIGLISLGLLYKKHISSKKFFTLGAIFFIGFFLFISPYLFHLHSLTGNWGLSNKWASNLRQAELRWIEKMDDTGFERAVAELTPDKRHLIAGFAGGMPYDSPQIKWSLQSFILKNPMDFWKRVLKNQRKLFFRNIPELFLGKSPSLFYSEDLRFKNNYIFLAWSILPLMILLFGIYKTYTKQKLFFYFSLSFFLPAFIFFTLFFTLNRYFLIFLPLFLIVFCYGIQAISADKGKKILQVFFIGNLISILLLSTSVYYHTESPKDEYYSLKKQAGKWLQEYSQNNPKIKILERFPIVTYYSWSKTRYITPYTSNIEDIRIYGQYNNIDILVVDSMDFLTYRPQLKRYLALTPPGFSKLKEFQNTRGQKVILYKLR